jgi:hypothetical protein
MLHHRKAAMPRNGGDLVRRAAGLSQGNGGILAKSMRCVLLGTGVTQPALDKAR